MNEAPVEAVGPYRLGSLLGKGGMGEVYRAFDERLGRSVAVKHIRPEVAGDPEIHARFQREARAALGDCGEDAPCYLVANIRTRSGRDLAAAHRVGNVTLVLLDGDGQRVEILAGERSREELSRRFKALARAA